VMAGNDAETHIDRYPESPAQQAQSGHGGSQESRVGAVRTPGGISQNPGPTTSIDAPSDSATRFVTC
jgi:hypothetical protein